MIIKIAVFCYSISRVYELRLNTSRSRKHNLSLCSIYKGNWDDTQWKWIIDEKANQKYIKQLKQDKFSDLEEKPDCSHWE